MGETEHKKQGAPEGHAGGHGDAHGHGAGHGDAHGHGDAKKDEHGGGHGKNPMGKYIGMTMALLGVLLALCSAMVGGSRTELVATMVEQTATGQQYQAVSMKHRTLMAQLQQLHALLPSDPADFEKSEKQLTDIENAAAASKNPAGPALHTLRLETSNVLNTVTPTGSDVLRFVSLVRDYEKQKDVAGEWAESYEDAIEAHKGATEHFEWAQLCAEFGIVFASIALMLQNRAVWGVSLLLAVSSMGIAGWAFTTSRAKLSVAEHKIEEGKSKYLGLHMDEGQAKGDEDLLKDIERIEAPAAAAANVAAPAHTPEHGAGEHGHDAPAASAAAHH